jgi:class I lanthipeptide synthase
LIEQSVSKKIDNPGMEKAINQRLKEIYSSLKAVSPTNISLMDGKTGAALFNFEYLQHTKNPEISQYLNETAQELAEGSVVETDPGFCSGRAGINWFFAYLFKKDLLTLTDWQLLCEEDGELEESAISMIKCGNYDFLYGAVGIAYHLLYTHKDSGYFFKNLFHLLKLLESSSVTGNIIPHFDSQQYQSVPDQVDLGLSHGITSILKFCLQCIAQNTCVEEATLLAEKIIHYLTTHARSGESMSYFPNFVHEIRPMDKREDGLMDISEKGPMDGNEASRQDANNVRLWPSRLAWCYGDLGIGYILYQAGIMLNKKETSAFALNVLTHSAGRRDDADTMLKDAGICHGSAGIAHIYNKIWHDTHLPVFKEACDFWIQKTLDMATYPDGIAGYKKYGGATGVYEKTPALIDGAAGIGLVLLSYLTGDFSWDYCFMLNNQ